MATYKYRQYINGVNDSVDVVTTTDGVEDFKYFANKFSNFFIFP